MQDRIAAITSIGPSGSDPGVAGPVRRFKLAIPPLPADAVDRPALLALLDQTTLLPLTLVVAGAGYGKTTLLAAWARRTTSPVAWVSLDRSDADLSRFATHVAAAIAQAAPGSLPALRLLLGGNRSIEPAIVAEVLADDLLDLEEPVALVLDDAHAIGGTPSETMLELLLAVRHPNLHLVISSRTRPGLPEAQRLHGRGLMTELGPDDLRFTPEDTVALLGLDDANAAADLARRTDGWAAGLRAVALGGDHAGKGERLRSLVRADVLVGQPPEISALLADVAVAERVSPGLAAALSRRPIDAEVATSLLAEAERRGLFVSRIDDGGTWWRLHPLMREALMDNPDRNREGHLRAGRWFAAAGMAQEAVDHAIRGGHIETAGALLADHSAAWLEGTLHEPVDWMDSLPPAALRAHPVFLVAKARALMTRSNVEAAFAACDEAAAAIAAIDPEERDPRLNPLRNELVTVRGLTANLVGDAGPVMDELAALMDDPAASGPRLLSEAFAPWAFAMARRGRGEEAEARLARFAASAANPAGPVAHSAQLTLAGLALRRADVRAATQWVTKVTAADATPALARSRLWGHAVLAGCWYEQDAVEEAVAIARAGLPIAPDSMVMARSMVTHVLVRGLIAQGRLAEARAALADDRRKVDLVGAEVLEPGLEALEALIDLAAGDLDRAGRWAGTEPRWTIDIPLRLHDAPVVTQARIWLARDRQGDAARAASALAAAARHERENRVGLMLSRLLPLLAIARQRQGDAPGARIAIEEALALGSGIMTRRFVDAGPDAISLLSAVAADRGAALAERAAAVLALIGREEAAAPDASSPSLAPNPLSAREVEILAMIADWRINKEIAEALGISVSTVRNHTIRIYRKLGVGDRRDAVDAALSAGWLTRP